jgi:outer membrane protein OmpA-like peptidoglycan-associated protein
VNTLFHPAPAPNPKDTLIMRYRLTSAALLSSLLVAACATTPEPPRTLVDARSSVRIAELDSAVALHAPMELRKASDSLNRANSLLDKGASLADIDSAAYVAQQQARTAIAIAQAKGNDSAIAGAEVERERARADMRTVEASRAQDRANAAQVQASTARAQANVSEQRASSAERQTAAAQADASEAQMRAGQLQTRLSELQARQTERGMLVTLGDVLFEFNRADVRPAAQPSLRKLADFLQQYPTRRILIEGHTDSVGSASANEVLSRRRAEAVDTALMGMGVAAQRVTTVGYGEEFPIAGNATDTDRALNRRVEVYIADNDQPVRTRRQ